MPTRAARPCSHPGCPALVRQGRYCPVHQGDRDAQDRVIRERYEQRTQRGTAAERGYGREWAETSKRFLKAHPRCARCGARATVAHHIIPKDQGGPDEEANLLALCQSCHNKIHRV